MVISENFIKEIIIRNNWIINFSICYVITATCVCVIQQISPAKLANCKCRLSTVYITTVNRTIIYLFIFYIRPKYIRGVFFRVIFDLGRRIEEVLFRMHNCVVRASDVQYFRSVHIYYIIRACVCVLNPRHPQIQDLRVELIKIYGPHDRGFKFRSDYNNPTQSRWQRLTRFVSNRRRWLITSVLDSYLRF